MAAVEGLSTQVTMGVKASIAHPMFNHVVSQRPAERVREYHVIKRAREDTPERLGGRTLDTSSSTCARCIRQCLHE